eukprot:SAG31_NODE_1821_length_7194_cov_11.104863_5_plen_174_part_00
MAVWISSHCHQGSEGKDYSARVTLVRQLSEYVSIARFGKCGHNVDWDTNVEGDRKAQDKSLEKIKFLLSFENNVCEFYMSEKIWKAYALGMVPVIYAAPSVVDVLPANDSFINVRDFSSVKELGAGLSAACNTLYCVGMLQTYTTYIFLIALPSRHVAFRCTKTYRSISRESR